MTGSVEGSFKPTYTGSTSSSEVAKPEIFNNPAALNKAAELNPVEHKAFLFSLASDAKAGETLTNLSDKAMQLTFPNIERAINIQSPKEVQKAVLSQICIKFGNNLSPNEFEHLNNLWKDAFGCELPRGDQQETGAGTVNTPPDKAKTPKTSKNSTQNISRREVRPPTTSQVETPEDHIFTLEDHIFALEAEMSLWKGRISSKTKLDILACLIAQNGNGELTKEAFEKIFTIRTMSYDGRKMPYEEYVKLNTNDKYIMALEELLLDKTFWTERNSELWDDCKIKKGDVVQEILLHYQDNQAQPLRLPEDVVKAIGPDELNEQGKKIFRNAWKDYPTTAPVAPVAPAAPRENPIRIAFRNFFERNLIKIGFDLRNFRILHTQQQINEALERINRG